MYWRIILAIGPHPSANPSSLFTNLALLLAPPLRQSQLSIHKSCLAIGPAPSPIPALFKNLALLLAPPLRQSQLSIHKSCHAIGPAPQPIPALYSQISPCYWPQPPAPRPIPALAWLPLAPPLPLPTECQPRTRRPFLPPLSLFLQPTMKSFNYIY